MNLEQGDGNRFAHLSWGIFRFGPSPQRRVLQAPCTPTSAPLRKPSRSRRPDETAGTDVQKVTAGKTAFCAETFRLLHTSKLTDGATEPLPRTYRCVQKSDVWP